MMDSKPRRLLTLAAAVAVLAVTVFLAEAGEEAGRQSEFTGRVIDIGDDYVELKRGAKEIRLGYTEATRFVGPDGAAADKNVIELCQVVKAVYLPIDRTGELAIITIVKEGNCGNKVAGDAPAREAHPQVAHHDITRAVMEMRRAFRGRHRTGPVRAVDDPGLRTARRY